MGHFRAPFRQNDDELTAFLQSLWDALVPASGECASVQGELVRARARLENEHYRNGLGNYYTPYEDDHGFADGFYPQMLLFVVDTLVANANDANDAATVSYFARIREIAKGDWDVQQRIDEIAHRESEEDRDLTDDENLAIEELEASAPRIAWEGLFARSEIAVANYCLANPVLVDRAGKPVKDRGLADVRHVFDPPPPPPVCGLCNGRGWLKPADPTQFPAICSCKTNAAPS